MYTRCVSQVVLSAIVAVLCVTRSAAEESREIKRLDGSNISAAQIDATVARLMKAAEVPGIAITVFNGGHAAYSKAYGYRDKEKRLPLTENSVVGAASLTKVAFAYMVMQLVEEGVIDLDKPVYQYFPKSIPEYGDYADIAGDPRYKKITARMLLSHTAGFPNWRWINDDRKLNINFEPGTKYAYSGEGIQLLQFVVQTATKRMLADLMNERIFQPFGMTRTSMVSERRFEDDYANGYDEYGRSLGHQNRKTANAAGSMQTTLHDYTLFLQAVMEGKRLKPATRELMLKPQIRIRYAHQFPTLQMTPTEANDGIRLSYGLGWGLFWTPYGKAFFKEGHDEGFRHYAVVFDERKDGMLIMSNSSNAEGIFKELLETVLGNSFTPIEWEGFTPYDKLPPLTPLPKHTEVKLAPAQLDRFVGRYVLTKDLVLTVARSGDHLAMRENDETAQDMFAESESSFFSKASDDVVTFDTDASGHVMRLVIHTDGREISVNREK